MIGRIVFGILLCSFVAVALPFSRSVAERPVLVKLGALPEAEPLKMVSGDQRYLLAQYAVVRVLFYYGTLIEKFQQKIVLKPEYGNMFRTLETASRLDPWNADVYYFTNAAFTWELGKVAEVNAMLDYGMKYRTWDYQLPFFAGFNAAYFLKDYPTAARYFQKAARLRPDPLLTNLSSRYFFEAGENRIGLAFLDYMEQHTMDRKVMALYELRKKALLAVIELQEAADRYAARFGHPPQRISDLTAQGLIGRIPADPYGGQFYLDDQGKVRSTSKFAFAPPAGKQEKTNPKEKRP
jgi:tetratricopeptide (TPR) repeat protein